MSTAMTVPQADWESREMVETLKQTVARGATDAQFKMFVEVCKATGLNPFLKEIWFVPNVGVMAGRDGYLRIANAHPQFDGMSTTVERDADGIPIKATCSVWRKDRSHPITCEAFYNEYRKNSQVWQTYKSAMISKVAEVLALKRSFSINGIVTEEEIGEQKLAAQDAQQDVAQRKIKELTHMGHKVEVMSTPAETIIELADSLDQPPEPPLLDPTYEQREKQRRDEAQAALKETGKKAPRNRGTISFKDLKLFNVMKQELAKIVGDDHEYYDMLKLSGVSHADELNAEQSKPVYKLMAERYKQLKQEKQDKELLMEAQRHALRIGPKFTKEILDKKGLASVEDILNLGGDDLTDLLQELKTTA